VFNDRNFGFWKGNDVHTWPTIMIVGPDGKKITHFKGENKEKKIEALLYTCLKYFNK
jgi:hypothetical protein